MHTVQPTKTIHSLPNFLPLKTSKEEEKRWGRRIRERRRRGEKEEDEKDCQRKRIVTSLDVPNRSEIKPQRRWDFPEGKFQRHNNQMTNVDLVEFLIQSVRRQCLRQSRQFKYGRVLGDTKELQVI